MAKLIGTDQFGQIWTDIDSKRPKASLLEKLYRNSATPMFIGKGTHIGYVVAAPKGSDEVSLWVTLHTVEPWTGKAG